MNLEHYTAYCAVPDTRAHDILKKFFAERKTIAEDRAKMKRKVKATGVVSDGVCVLGFEFKSPPGDGWKLCKKSFQIGKNLIYQPVGEKHKELRSKMKVQMPDGAELQERLGFGAFTTFMDKLNVYYVFSKVHNDIYYVLIPKFGKVKIPTGLRKMKMSAYLAAIGE